MTKVILSIDPGTIQSAYVLWDVPTDSIIDKKIVPNDIMLHIIKENQEAYVFIEMVASYGMPVGKEVFETVLWIGRFVQVSNKYRLVYRKDVKMYWCHSMKAKDSNIRQALIDKYGEPGTKNNQGKLYGVSKDIWSALAIASYSADMVKSEEYSKAQVT
jgi:hypothetical protein